MIRINILHHFCIYASHSDWLFCFPPQELPSKTALRRVRKAISHAQSVKNCSPAQIFLRRPVSTPILDTARNLLQINTCLLQYFRHFVSSRNPYQTRFELPSFVIKSIQSILSINIKSSKVFRNSHADTSRSSGSIAFPAWQASNQFLGAADFPTLPPGLASKGRWS